jgi:hypothetical protein
MNLHEKLLKGKKGLRGSGVTCLLALTGVKVFPPWGCGDGSLAGLGASVNDMVGPRRPAEELPR